MEHHGSDAVIDPADPSGLPDLLGRDFGERYLVQSKLGAGGIGIVYRALDRRLDRPVALKVLQQMWGAAAQRFEREAKVLASLTHPNIVSILDYGVSENMPYLVMELLEGETLADALARERPFGVARASHIMRQLLLGLGYMHEHGLVHRDLKPGNVFLQKLPDGEHVKLLDFGLARAQTTQPEGQITRSGEIFGTPGYMPPEQLCGQVVDARADVYSVAAVFFEMLAGQRPFVGELQDVARRQLTEWAPLLQEARADRVASPGLESLLQRALSVTPAHRPSHASAFAELLQALPEPRIYEGRAAGRWKRRAAVKAAKKTRAQLAAAAGGTAVVPQGASQGAALPGHAAAPGQASLAFAPTVALGQVAAADGGTDGVLARVRRAITELVHRVVVASALTVAMVSLLAIGGAIAFIYLERSGSSADVSQVQKALPASVKHALDAMAASAAPAVATGASPSPASAAAAPAAAAAPRPRAQNPFRAPIPRSLAKLRTLIDKGTTGNERMLVQLRRYNREHPTDARGHLLLARLYENRGWDNDTMTQYEFAFARDPSVRGDPHMLRDLLALVRKPATFDRASRLLQTIYGQEAREAVGRALSTASPAERAPLERLQDLLARAP